MSKPRLMTGSQMRRLLPKYRKYLSWTSGYQTIEIQYDCRVFTFAATDTTSSALSRILWLLAQRQDVQDKLRLEIREAPKGQGNLEYDALMNLPYLDAVCKETLRL